MGVRIRAATRDPTMRTVNYRRQPCLPDTPDLLRNLIRNRRRHRVPRQIIHLIIRPGRRVRDRTSVRRSRLERRYTDRRQSPRVRQPQQAPRHHRRRCPRRRLRRSLRRRRHPRRRNRPSPRYRRRPPRRRRRRVSSRHLRRASHGPPRPRQRPWSRRPASSRR